MAEVVNLYEPNFSTTERAGVATVAARADLELDTDRQPEFERTLAEVVGSAACSAVVVDLSQAAFMDAGGLNALISSRNAAQEQAKSFVVDLAGPRTAEIVRLFELTGVIDTMFVITDEQPERPPRGRQAGPFMVYSNSDPTSSFPGKRGGEARRPQLRVLQGGAETAV